MKKESVITFVLEPPRPKADIDFLIYKLTIHFILTEINILKKQQRSHMS